MAPSISAPASGVRVVRQLVLVLDMQARLASAILGPDGGTMITARELIDEYLDALVAAGPEGVREYAFDDRDAWTARATLALVKAGRRVTGAVEAASRGTKDRYYRSEYLCLDVTLYDNAGWKPPLFIAEHENYGGRMKVQYCAWKLLVVEAQRRMLVAYFGAGTEFETFDQLRDAVRVVCQDNRGKDIILVAGNNGSMPKNPDELRDVHDSVIVGVHS